MSKAGRSLLPVNNRVSIVGLTILFLSGCSEDASRQPATPQAVRWPEVLENVLEKPIPGVRWLDLGQHSLRAVAVQDDGRRAALESSCETILYDLSTGRQLHTWPEPTKFVQFSEGGKLLLTRRKNVFTVWDGQTFASYVSFQRELTELCISRRILSRA